MSARITAIAEALKNELNAHAFSLAFTATRSYQPLRDLTDFKTLRVTVVPGALTMEPDTRESTQDDHIIHVAVQKKLAAPANNAELDPLMALVQEIVESVRFIRLDAFPDAAWLKAESVPIFIPEHLEQKQQFTSVIAFTYRTSE